MSGGGGGGSYYGHLNDLYDVQTKQAQKLMDLADSSVYPAFNELGQQSRDTGSLANRENAASVAGADAAAARDQSRASMMDTMASFGINPGDATFQRNLARSDIASTAADAAGRTGARMQQDALGFARLKDFTSLGMGVPSAATDATNAAGRSASTAGQMWQQNQQANSQAMGSAVRGGIDLYGLMKADGGLIEKPLRLKGGGYVQRLAGGGVVGAMRGIAPAAPPPSAPPQASAGNQLLGSAAPAVAKPGIGGSMVEGVGNMTGSNYLASVGKGMQLGADAQPAIDAYSTAASQVNSVLPAAAETSNALVGGAGAAEGAGAAMAAEGAATTASGLGLGAALGTAMPWVGAAMLAGSALGLFKDGGHVTPGSDGTDGGKVAGPGGPKDDMVPALLSDGEFVMPVGAVKKFGLDRLEKMRQAGLEFEKQLGITA